MPNVLLSPWRGGTPRRLCKHLGLYLRTPEQIRAIPVPHIGTLVNWGCSLSVPARKTFNRASLVAAAASKLMSFRVLENAKLPTLEFTTDRNMAESWRDVASVFAHTDPHAHSAQGLTLIKKGTGDALPDAKVYTKYFPKTVESRTHIIRTDKGFDHMYMEKRRVLENRYAEFGLKESPSTFVRTWGNGWIFAREVQEDGGAVELALKAAAAFKLDYCAVDIMKDKKGTYVVGEINTAPGLEGKALEFYVSHLEQML